MVDKLLLLSAVFVPVSLSLLLPLAGKASKTFRNYITLALTLFPLVASIIIAPTVFSGNAITYNKTLLLGFNLVFNADALAVFMAIVSSLISSIVVLYSFDYISHYENQNEYYAMVVLFLGSMMGLVYSGNLIFLYVFWEITAFSSWRLIGFFREKKYVIKADKAFLITMFGAVLMLLGFIMLFMQTGSFDLLAIKQALLHNQISAIVILLILAGILSKSATLPFQTWLPDAGVAPSPVTALLHAAVLVKIGVYVFARIFIVTLPLDQFWQIAVPTIAGVSALVSAGAAMIDCDLKRIIAYSTISQIGFIFLGLSCNNPIGIAGALLYILMHGLAKGGLFLCAGIIEQNTKTKDITKLGGLFATMPWTAVAFLFCAFSIMGVPPFGGFFSKFMVIMGSAQTGNYWITSMFILAAFLTIIYLFRAFNMIFMGEAKTPLVKEGSGLMVGSVVLLAVLSLAGGLFISYPASMVQTVVSQMIGVIR